MKTILILLSLLFVATASAQEFEKIIIKNVKSPGVVKAADFNGDSLLDLAVMDLDSEVLSVYLQQSPQNFVLSQQMRVKDLDRKSFVLDFSIGHFDEDNNFDILVHNLKKNQFLYRGLGEGRFTDGEMFYVGMNIENLLTTFTVPGSAHSQLFVINSKVKLGGFELEVLKSDSSEKNKMYNSIRRTIDLNLLFFEQNIAEIALEIDDFAIGDFNGDSHLDLVIACATEDFLIFFTGDENYQFEPLQLIKTEGRVSKIFMVDLNNDQKDEIIVGHNIGKQSRVYTFTDENVSQQQYLVTDKYIMGFSFDKSNNVLA
ncbi:MAG: VCBS repeat-containing protein, partial [Bdellovibrionales bacterium]|nr:VCBS repeat-containing protein [Bdellovibrionales bacterium]